MDIQALLAGFGLQDDSAPVVVGGAKQAPTIVAPYWRNVELDAIASSASARLAMRKAAHMQALCEELGINMQGFSSADTASAIAAMQQAADALAKARKRAGKHDYAAKAAFASEKRGTKAGGKAREDLRQQFRFLTKLLARAESQGDSSKAASLRLELNALARGRKLVRTTSGHVRAKQGFACAYSAVGKSKSDWGRVINNASGSAWVKPADIARAKAGKLALAPSANADDAIERLEAMGEKPKAAKVLIKNKAKRTAYASGVKLQAGDLPQGCPRDIEPVSCNVTALPNGGTLSLDDITAARVAAYKAKLEWALMPEQVTLWLKAWPNAVVNVEHIEAMLVQ